MNDVYQSKWENGTKIAVNFGNKIYYTKSAYVSKWIYQQILYSEEANKDSYKVWRISPIKSVTGIIICLEEEVQFNPVFNLNVWWEPQEYFLIRYGRKKIQARNTFFPKFKEQNHLKQNQA